MLCEFVSVISLTQIVKDEFEMYYGIFGIINLLDNF